MKADIKNIDDIQLFVNAFYAKVQTDKLLSPIFFSTISGDWQAHLNRMYLFWNAALFGERGYVGNPFAKHATLNIEPHHFERWLTLFGETISQHFEGPMAIDAVWRASVMAQNFIKRLATIAQTGNIPLL
jgi:hemoglobin